MHANVCIISKYCYLTQLVHEKKLSGGKLQVILSFDGRIPRRLFGARVGRREGGRVSLIPLRSQWLCGDDKGNDEGLVSLRSGSKTYLAAVMHIWRGPVVSP